MARTTNTCADVPLGTETLAGGGDHLGFERESRRRYTPARASQVVIYTVSICSDYRALPGVGVKISVRAAECGDQRSAACATLTAAVHLVTA